MKSKELRFNSARVHRKYTGSFITLDFERGFTFGEAELYIAFMYPEWELICCMMEADEQELEYMEEYEQDDNE
tara:strand:+ start:299 stop:517 length:219 start_codon:yes stop_codon:yes gene_type:complete